MLKQPLACAVHCCNSPQQPYEVGAIIHFHSWGDGGTQRPEQSPGFKPGRVGLASCFHNYIYTSQVQNVINAMKETGCYESNLLDRVAGKRWHEIETCRMKGAGRRWFWSKGTAGAKALRGWGIGSPWGWRGGWGCRRQGSDHKGFSRPCLSKWQPMRGFQQCRHILSSKSSL